MYVRNRVLSEEYKKKKKPVNNEIQKRAETGESFEFFSPSQQNKIVRFIRIGLGLASLNFLAKCRLEWNGPRVYIRMEFPRVYCRMECPRVYGRYGVS